jgi:putative hydrolase of the HAD superfamily
MRVHGTFRPKPSAAMLRHVLAREGLAGRPNAGRAVLVEDTLSNLKAARAAGFRTVLVTRHRGAGLRRGGAYVDLRVASVQRLPRMMDRVR